MTYDYKSLLNHRKQAHRHARKITCPVVGCRWKSNSQAKINGHVAKWHSAPPPVRVEVPTLPPEEETQPWVDSYFDSNTDPLDIPELSYSDVQVELADDRPSVPAAAGAPPTDQMEYVIGVVPK